MIIEVEKLIFDFLVEKLQDKKVTVYHGLLPEIMKIEKKERARKASFLLLF